jgi:sigma-B regulation protein RsbU (phosphoserine phosphatase)
MEPADEVGGDYYDVIQSGAHTVIGIGDVMGHGLQSGVLMLMLQTAVQTLVSQGGLSSDDILQTLNRVLCKNIQRMGVSKTVTLSLIDYYQDQLYITGQHEEIVIVRSSGELELIDTIDLGIPLGLESNIYRYLNSCQIELHHNDVLVLFTDGITEAENSSKEFYGLERLCEVAKTNASLSAEKIKERIIFDLKKYAGNAAFYDDITLLVVKKK